MYLSYLSPFLYCHLFLVLVGKSFTASFLSLVTYLPRSKDSAFFLNLYLYYEFCEEYAFFCDISITILQPTHTSLMAMHLTHHVIFWHLIWARGRRVY